MTFFPYGKQIIDRDDIDEVVRVLSDDYITQGPRIQIFEKNLREVCQSKYAVVFSSGTAALHAAYFASGLKEGDEFITSPITFLATANAGLYVQARPVFADIVPETGNIDPVQVEAAITAKTRLIVPVHYGGNPANMKRLSEIAKKFDCPMVEDACHALGSTMDGLPTGNCRFSDMTVFSFHPVKHITSGEGGAVTTNSSQYYERLLMFREHGITRNSQQFIRESEGPWYYEMQNLGFNYRLTDIQAALGNSQLKKLNTFVRARREIAEFYQTLFCENPYFDLVPEESSARNSYHLFPILLNENLASQKAKIFTRLREKNIGVQVHYIPIYRQPYYMKLGYGKNVYPNAEKFYQRVLSIPMYAGLGLENAQVVANSIISVMKELA